MTKIAIQQIAFTPDGVQIGYYLPATDLKSNGLAILRTLVIPSGDEYDDEIGDVAQAAIHLVRDALDDWDRLPAMRETAPIRDATESFPAPPLRG